MFDSLTWRSRMYERHLLGLDDEELDDDEEFEEWDDSEEEQRYYEDQIDDDESPFVYMARLAADIERGRAEVPRGWKLDRPIGLPHDRRRTVGAARTPRCTRSCIRWRLSCPSTTTASNSWPVSTSSWPASQPSDRRFSIVHSSTGGGFRDLHAFSLVVGPALAVRVATRQKRADPRGAERFTPIRSSTSGHTVTTRQA